MFLEPFRIPRIECVRRVLWTKKNLRTPTRQTSGSGTQRKRLYDHRYRFRQMRNEQGRRTGRAVSERYRQIFESFGYGKKVCPCKRIAVGMALYEKVGNCRVLKGHKSFVASHSEGCCADITLKNIHFVLPEEIAETLDKSSLCHERKFEPEFTSHYIDM